MRGITSEQPRPTRSEGGEDSGGDGRRQETRPAYGGRDLRRVRLAKKEKRPIIINGATDKTRWAAFANVSLRYCQQIRKDGTGVRKANQGSCDTTNDPRVSQIEEFQFNKDSIAVLLSVCSGSSRRVPIALAIRAAMPENTDALELLKWNRIHRSHKFASAQDKSLRIRNAQQYLNAVTSGNRYLLDDYDTHDFRGCDICHSRGLKHSRESIDAERRKAEVEAAAAKHLADSQRWNNYPFREPRTPEHNAAFRANRQFDYVEAQAYWINEHKTYNDCVEAAIVYFAEKNQPFTREEYDWVMQDMYDCYKSRYGEAVGA